MAIYSSNTSCPEVNHSEKLPSINILSIDFDWIMAPSIEAYNARIREDEDKWHEIFNNAFYYYPVSCEKYKQLCGLLTRIQPTDYCFTDSHKEIIDYIPKWIPAGEAFHIYNIDHHHDMGYWLERPDYDEITIQPTCGNWAAYINRLIPTQFQYYTWINNPTSQNNMFSEIAKKFAHFESTQDITILNNVHIDKLFVCSSFPWIPLEYRPLYDVMKLLFENSRNK